MFIGGYERDAGGHDQRGDGKKPTGDSRFHGE
jgi:hypothetical protein